MTKLKRNAIVLFLVCFCFGINLKADPGVKIMKDGQDKSMILNFFDWKSQTAQIKIINNKGIEVWKNEIPVKHLTSIRYNLKELPEGDYLVYIGNELSVTIQPIEIKKDEIALNEIAKREVFQPMIQMKGNTLDFSHLTLGNKTQVKIVDNQSNILYAEEFTDTTQIEKRFNLMHLDKGRYQLLVSTQGETFVKSITLD